MSQLRAFVERIERLEEEISTLNADKSEVYKEAKSTGFDVKVLRKVIAARRMDRSERQEAETLFDLYMAELEGSGLVRARTHGNIEEFAANAATKQRVNVLPQHETGQAAALTREASQATVHNAGVTVGRDRQPIHDDIPQFLRAQQ